MSAQQDRDSAQGLAFDVGATRYAVALSHVAEVITLGPVTVLPLAPASVLGVVHVHGVVATLIDLPHVLEGRSSRLRPADSGIWLRDDDGQIVLFVGRIRGVIDLATAVAHEAVLRVDVPRLIHGIYLDMASAAAPVTQRSVRDSHSEGGK